MNRLPRTPELCAKIRRAESMEAVARALGVPGKRVRDWCKVDRVPDEYIYRVEAALKP